MADSISTVEKITQDKEKKYQKFEDIYSRNSFSPFSSRETRGNIQKTEIRLEDSATAAPQYTT